MPALPSKALLCLHGGGTSASIFRMQLAKIRLALKDEFEFVFMNAPYLAPAGPGVLPIFASAAPFYGWFGGSSATFENRLESINASVRAAVEEWEGSRRTGEPGPAARIVGLLAFSEGALAATMLLWQQQLGRLPWLPCMRFAILICCFFPDQAAAHMMADDVAATPGHERTLIRVPTLHLHGRQDFSLVRARKLVREHYEPNAATILEFEGGHQVPTGDLDCRRAVAHIVKLDRS
ncbi:serine hydrolase FSH [Colletotrichum cereale]|nr:serine hydrolase FSH [Colletotrichum cereale]